MSYVSPMYAQQFVGQNIQALARDGSVVTGRLVKVDNGVMYLQPIQTEDAGKTVRTKAVIPLVLFNLLAISTLPYVYGTPFPQPRPYYPVYGGRPDWDDRPGGCCGGRDGYPGF